MQPSSSKFTVPRRFFSHFYMVAVVCTTLLLLTTWLYAYTMATLTSEPFHFSQLASHSHLTGGSHIFSLLKSHLTPLEHRYRVWHAVFLLLLMEVQVLRRLFESLYVFNYRPSARMHIFGHLTGLCNYIAAPLSPSCACAPEVFRFTLNLVSDFTVEEKNQMPAIESVNPLMKLGWLRWTGSVIFFFGVGFISAVVIQFLANAEQVDEYVIPTGDWFEIVSSPYYLAEIVANLGFAAAETHKWYLRKFENYPRNRFFIIPFIF
ncbi:hypothetical protein CRYUN_Cryun18bG0112500 [Craigia yunnanensis]